MKFAFLIHPISEETKNLLELDPEGRLRNVWGQDLLGFCRELHRSVSEALQQGSNGSPPRVRVVDELPGLVSLTGARAEGRLYEIPMGAREILAEPARAVGYILEAVNMAADWGAKLVGLGALTGVVGGQGAYLADRVPVAITTGNSLTVHAAMENLLNACREAGVYLADEMVAVVGVPGSIASAAAVILARCCKSLLLVGRRPSSRASHLAERLDAELSFDIPHALRRARIIVSATSSGDCIDQSWLLPGSIVVDVAVPTDVQGNQAQRDDVLIISGGLARVPLTMPLDSHYLWFHHGIVPCCLGETITLAMEDRAENFSLGRSLCQSRIEEVGEIADRHGFDFSRLFSFGLPLKDAAIVQFRKAVSRRATRPSNVKAHKRNGAKRPAARLPSPADLAPRAASLHARHINPVLVGLGEASGFVKTFERGQGMELWDSDGQNYLDFVAGFGSLNLGHNHPTVVQAIGEAMSHGAPGFVQSAVNPYAAALAEQLATLAPDGLEMVFFTNSGSEAVEAALKLARRVTGRDGLLYCDRSYHGKTFGSLSVTGNSDYQRPFGNLLSGCCSVPYGDHDVLAQSLASRQFAALIVEPLQAEGGMHLPPPTYLREAQHLCRKAGTLLIVDEVQTGLGRTGTMFAVDQYGIEPDVMTVAKSLGGGLMPIGAMLCRRDCWMHAYGTMQTFALHTSTFGGGSLACAAGLAALKVLRDEDLAANAATRGGDLHNGLAEICRRRDVLCEVRGQGLLLGLEFNPTPASIKAHWMDTERGRASSLLVPNLDVMLDAVSAVYVMYNLLQVHHIYTQTTRSDPRVLRIQPPLGITAEQVSRFLTAVDACTAEIDFSNRTIDGIIAKSGLGQHQANSHAHPTVR